MIEITRHHVENGRAVEALFRRIREIAEGARGNVVALRPSRLASDMRAMRYVGRILRELCHRRGCHIHRRGKLVWYIFTVDALKSITLDELKQLATAQQLPAGGLELGPKPRRGRPPSSESGGEKMPIITLHIPLPWLRAIDELVKSGRYPHRSA
ncbi:MAG: hypothetical protein ACP5J0_03770, partial [Pyrobaculum sp.]